MRYSILLAVLLIVAVGFAVERVQSRREYEHIPSPYELQRMLVERGYDIKVDGKIGPQTMEAWNSVYIQQSANSYFK